MLWVMSWAWLDSDGFTGLVVLGWFHCFGWMGMVSSGCFCVGVVPWAWLHWDGCIGLVVGWLHWFGCWLHWNGLISFNFIFLLTLLISSHFTFSLSLPRRKSDSGSLSRLFPPLPTTVHAFVFIARIIQHFLPPSTRIELFLNFVFGWFHRIVFVGMLLCLTPVPWKRKTQALHPTHTFFPPHGPPPPPRARALSPLPYRTRPCRCLRFVLVNNSEADQLVASTRGTNATLWRAYGRPHRLVTA